MSAYRKFSYKGANFRISSDRYEVIIDEIIEQRQILESYIRRQPVFLSSLVPITLLPDAPEIAVRMHEASAVVGVGPMAAVAGVFAQTAAEAALKAGGTEAVVENGGDIYIHAKNEVVIGLYADENPLSGKLGLAVSVEQMPLSICSSSGRMGHSFSMSRCDLATVVAKDAALADAAATHACNLVQTVADIDPVMEKIMNIENISGVLIIKDDRVGVCGKLPRLVRHTDDAFPDKVTRDTRSLDRR